MSPSILMADKTATQAHRGQLRDGGDPYITHPRRVRNTLAIYGLPEYVQVAGLLHDVLEDTKIEPRYIEEEFGAEVLFLIQGMTKIQGQDYVQQILEFARIDPLIVFLKLSDRLDNLQTMECWDSERVNRYLEESLQLLEALKSIEVLMDQNTQIKFKMLMVSVEHQIQKILSK